MKAKVKKSSLYYIIILLALCAISLTVAGGGGLNKTVHAAQVSLEGTGDEFAFSAESYGAGESFAFVSVAHFENGNAAGLVFGGKENDSCFVFNVDRAANMVKLMYFYDMAENRKVEVLKEEYYVGSAIMNEGERNYVQSRTANIDKVYLKVAVNADGTAEFYADGIRRFAYKNGSEEAEVININGFTLGDDDKTPIEYEGGFLGYNCFNAKVYFADTLIGETDYGYYGEFYRNQFHFSQFAHWNNDPNGLVYYNGYYHLYFQHNPYGNTWDAMHWGHARSKDLVHWELLPIALVPDRDLSTEGATDYGIGAMWSGSARVYHKGDSDKIDNEYKWFGETADKADGEPLGLIGFYTRFDNGGNRHQIVMYSTDGGLSWNKRNNIPSTVSKDLNGAPVVGGSWRDPKVFDISGITGIADGYRWGMVLTDMEDNTLFFLKSRNMVEWEHAGSYYVYRPECPDVFTLGADGGEQHTVITFTSRYYVVCNLAYEGGNIVMKDPETNAAINRLDTNGEYLQVMDYGVDSYAGQTFYIDESSDSAYKGKAVGVSWFSGVPNADESIESGVLQTARKVWNGGGMTIPVIYGLKKQGAKYALTSTPITVNDENFEKKQLNGLEEIKSHSFEITATVQNADRNPVYFRINGSEDGAHYTEIGWNAQDGYYVDRTHTEDAGINFPQPNYACKYASGMGKDNTLLDFYILSDNGGVEVYCDGFTVPFYILTFASPYSVRAAFTADDAASATVAVNEIASVWRTESEETLINLSSAQLDLGAELGQTQTITAYAQGKDISYEVTEGADIVRVEPTATGARITGLKAGEAQIKVSAGVSSRTISVTVHSGRVDGDFTFVSDGIVSGNWYYSGNALIGEQTGGDGFILASESGGDFTYSASFDLGSGAAAALVFRAAAENGKLSSYLIANYDNNSKIVKLWSQNGELGNVPAGEPDIRNLVLTAETKGRNVKVYLNGNKLIDCDIRENDPLNGKFGLNVCATKAAFSSVTVQKSEHDYSGSGNMVIKSGAEQKVLEIINVTLGNAALSSGQYECSGREITIKQSYMELLPQAGNYTFIIYGSAYTFTANVNVPSVPRTELEAIAVDSGISATLWLGNSKVDYVKVNGEEIDPSLYKIANYMLIISPEALVEGENTVQINDSQSVTVTVLEVPHKTATESAADGGANIGLIVGLSVGIVLAVGAAAAVTVIMLMRKKKGVSVKESVKENK